MGAGFLFDPRIERHVAVPCERRLRVARQRDRAHAEALEMLEKAQDLVRFSALGDQDRDVRFPDQSEVAVSAVSGMEEIGGGSGRGQSCRNLASDQSGLPDSGHDDTARRTGNSLDCASKIVADALLRLRERVGLHAQHSPPALDNVFAAHWLMRDQMSTARLTSSSSAESGNMLGPSLGAVSGVGCVSMKSACAPAAIAERARRGTNSRAPPLEPSGPCPGRCTLCVASKITGAPQASRNRVNERMSTTRSP